jgi:PhzF family phenazine biosynthesis protein
MTAEVLRYAAFPDEGVGGNPAGVVLDAGSLTDAQMLAISQAIGYSETAFLRPVAESSERRWRIRYFSPRAEVAFCGHATIAAAVALAERDGPGRLSLETNAGLVSVSTRREDDTITATLVSPPTSTHAVEDTVLTVALQALRIAPEDLDPRYPVRVAYGGNHHLVVGLRNLEVLDSLDYDYPALHELMAQERWTTVHVFWAEHPTLFHARNAFPPGGVREDPATGAAAAAFGGYLRELSLVRVPARLVVLQGRQMGAPSRLIVDIHEDSSRVDVTGSAVRHALSPYDDLDVR